MSNLKASPDLTGFSTITGTPAQIRARLAELESDRVVLFTFERKNEFAGAIAEMMESLVPLVGEIVERRQKGLMESIVDALVPGVPLPKHLMAEARMLAEARKAVIDGGDWLTAAQIAELAGFSATNTSTQPNKWKKDGLIFAVRHRNMDYFPAFGLNPDAGYRPVMALSDVLKTFGDAKDGWGLAYWFASQNSFLGGQRPQDLLAKQPDRVIAAAEDELVGIVHG